MGALEVLGQVSPGPAQVEEGSCCPSDHLREVESGHRALQPGEGCDEVRDEGPMQ